MIPSSAATLLTLPLEIRLDIYDLLIGPSQYYAVPSPYYQYTIQISPSAPTGSPPTQPSPSSSASSPLTPILSRSGFRKWDFRPNAAWSKWPARDTYTLLCLCRQINGEITEEFRPPGMRCAVVIRQDVSVASEDGMTRMDAIYASLLSRPWLMERIVLLRLELGTGGPDYGSGGGDADVDDGVDGSNNTLGIRNWLTACWPRPRTHTTTKTKTKSHPPAPPLTTQPPKEIPPFTLDTTSLIALLPHLPLLRKFELYISCPALIDISPIPPNLEPRPAAWLNPHPSILSLQTSLPTATTNPSTSTNPKFIIILSAPIALDAFRDFLAPHFGYLQPVKYGSLAEGGEGGGRRYAASDVLSRRLLLSGKRDTALWFPEIGRRIPVFCEEEKNGEGMGENGVRMGMRGGSESDRVYAGAFAIAARRRREGVVI